MVGDEFGPGFRLVDLDCVDRRQARVAEHFPHPSSTATIRLGHGRLHRDDRAVKTRPKLKSMEDAQARHWFVSKKSARRRAFSAFRCPDSSVPRHRAGGGVVDAAVAVRFDVHVEMQELRPGMTYWGRENPPAPAPRRRRCNRGWHPDSRRRWSAALPTGTLGSFFSERACLRHQIDGRAARPAAHRKALVLQEAGGFEPRVRK